MTKKRVIASLAGGALTGLFNGLFGGGGGMVAVPYLQNALSLPAGKAHATAIAVILPACAVSGVVYAAAGNAPLNVLLPVALGVSLGGYLGARLLNRLSGKIISLIFSLVMLAAGLRMLF